MELVDQLTKALGISDAQAQGGAGLLFKLAKDKLGTSEFSQLSAAVPEVDSLLNAAPSSGGLLGGLGKMLGGSSGGLAGLTGGFSNLGMDTGMAAKFVPIILQFVQTKGGDPLKMLLEKALK
jgi:hypothetical protein